MVVGREVGCPWGRRWRDAAEAGGRLPVSATIEDVARRAQVSVATVSRALRDLPNVAPTTRERVAAAARDLQYVADPSASRLAGGRGLTVGMVVPSLARWYDAQLLAGAEAELAANDRADGRTGGYELLPFSAASIGGMDRFFGTRPFRKRVDGLIVAQGPLDEDQIERIADAGVALVTVGFLHEETPGLTIDHAAAAGLAVAHLAGLGHRRVALLGGVDHEPWGFSPLAERYRGYTDAIEEAGLDADPQLAVPGVCSLRGGADAMHRLLALSVLPTALVACSDEMAIGAMQVARDAGLRVPGELSIVGIDDHDVAEYVGLTTVGQDVTGQGSRAVQLLLEYLTEGTAEVVHETSPTRLLVRRTTGPPASRSPRSGEP
jgi:LacI family transcriptional regulator, repressor for deo operon, udp, cdd, tsx, nupC, and nupG